MKKLRTVLIIFLVASLGLSIYTFFAYACFAGLCGGPQVIDVINNYHWFLSYYGYFTWIYPLLVFTCLYLSRLFSNKNQRSLSLMVLLLPVFFIIPLGHMEMIVNQIENKYTAQQAYYYSPHPKDYICSAEQFIRCNEPEEKLSYAFFQIIQGPYGPGNAVSYAYTSQELIQLLADKNIALSQCKNQLGQTLTLN